MEDTSNVPRIKGGNTRREAAPPSVLRDLPLLELGLQSAKTELHRIIERAVRCCGSAASLARRLGVKPPTVSQWRAGTKNPDALHLIRLLTLAKQIEEKL